MTVVYNACGFARKLTSNVVSSLTRIAVFVFVISSSGRASADEIRHVLVYADGPRAAAVRVDVHKALPTGIGPAAQPGFAKALVREGVKNIGAALAEHTDRAALTGNILRALDPSKADAVVIAHPLAARKGETRIWVIIAVRGEPGPRTDEALVLGVRATAAQRQLKWQKLLSAALAPKAEPEPTSAQPPPEPPPEPEPAKSEPTPALEVTRTAQTEPIAIEQPTPPPPVLLAHADGVFAFRWWRHDDPTYVTTRRYTASGILGVAAGLELFPLARAKSGIARDIGLAAEGLVAPGLRSSGPTASDVPTTFYAWSAALRIRIRPAPSTIGLSLGYGESVFDYGIVDQADRETPRGRYHMLRGGLDVRAPVGPLAFTGAVTYLHVLSAERISTFAPVPSSAPGHPDAIGFEAALGIAVQLAPAFDVHVGGLYDDIRYHADTWPAPSGRPGSVRDQTLAGRLGVGVTF